jgi:CheY-like chemotaxis protein
MTPLAETARGAPKILVVDDEEDIVTYLMAVLEDNGYRAVGEGDAAAALEAVKREQPDLILLDIMMPGQSGLSLYRDIRTNRSSADTPIFIITGYSREEDVARLLGSLTSEPLRLPEGYLEKPISVSKFLESVHALFQKQGK